MDQTIGWFYERRAQDLIRALNGNRMQAAFLADPAMVAAAVLERIPAGATVGMGGSMTLVETGVLAALRTGDLNLLDRFAEGMTPAERGEMARRSLTADVFVSGVNAVTEEGELVFVDASCSRVAPILCGPSKVIIVAGMNKLCPNLANAQERIRHFAAPANARRLGRATPCAETGQCADCASPERICNATVVIHKQADAQRLTVLLVGADLGL